MEGRRLLSVAALSQTFCLCLSCGTVSDNLGDDSVGDVAVGDWATGDLAFGQLVRARIRNESSYQADVTLRFVRDNRVVHRSFVRVPPETITTVASPRTSDRLELSGVNDAGDQLTESTFVFGVDFSASQPAEYWIRDRQTGEPTPEFPIPSGPFTALTLTVPAADVSVPLGGLLHVAWSDENVAPGALISIFLRPAGLISDDDLIPIATGITAAVDGLADRVQAVIQAIEPGIYFVLAKIEDGGNVVWSAAKGTVNVRRDPVNAAPIITLISPSTQFTLRPGETFTVGWIDRDPDDNASIEFWLDPSGSVGMGTEFFLGGPFAEDPDGAAFDSADLTANVLPGLYDLSARITDGRLVGVDRLPRRILVAPSPTNDPPRLNVREPATDLELERGATLLIRWNDGDDNDNARISFVLDPDLPNVPLDGDEILLASGIPEDGDGAHGELQVDLSPDIPIGVYRLLGVIHDGLIEVASRAPGLLYIGRRAVEPGDGGGGSGGGDTGGGGGPGDPDGGGNDGGIIILEPSGEIRIAVGQAIAIRLRMHTAVPVGASRRVLLSNLDHGGDVLVEIPGRIVQGEEISVTIPPGLIQNTSWPRVFDLEVETNNGGQMSVFRSPQVVWVRQEVELESAWQSPSYCPIRSTDRFEGIELRWYGGGYNDVDPPMAVQFWLSSDGSAPRDGRGDAGHELVYTGPSSPDLLQSLRLTQNPSSLVAEEFSAPVVPIGESLVPGRYYVVAVLDPSGPQRSASVLMDETIEVCARE